MFIMQQEIRKQKEFKETQMQGKYSLLPLIPLNCIF